MTYDLAALTSAGLDYQHFRAKMEDARYRVLAEVPKALRAGVPQVEIVKLTGMTRERIRQIARAAGIEG